MKPTVKIASLLLAVLMLFSVFASGCTLNKEWSYKTDDNELAIGVYLSAMYSAYITAQQYASKLDDYDASSEKWLDLEITDDDGNTAVARDWILDTAKRECLEFLAVEAKLKELGASADEAQIKQYETQAESYWYQSLKKVLSPKGVSMESFKRFYANYGLEKEKVFDLTYMTGGSQEVKKDEITKFFEENYIYYSYLPVALYDSTKDEAGATSNVPFTADKAKNITDTLDGYAKNVNDTADATDADELSEKLLKEYATANKLAEDAVQSGTALKDKTNAPADEVNEALKKLGEGKATTVKVTSSSDKSETYYYVVRHTTKAAKDNYLADDTHNEEIVHAMKDEEFKKYLADYIDEIGYKKSEYVDKYKPSMFFEKPSASNVTA